MPPPTSARRRARSIFFTGRAFTLGSATPLSFLSAFCAKKISISRCATSETTSSPNSSDSALSPSSIPRSSPTRMASERLLRRRILALGFLEQLLLRLVEEDFSADGVNFEPQPPPRPPCGRARAECPPGPCPCPTERKPRSRSRSTRLQLARRRARARGGGPRRGEWANGIHLVHQAQLARPVGLHRLAGEDELERLLSADEPGQPLRPARARQEPKLRLRQAPAPSSGCRLRCGSGMRARIRAHRRDTRREWRPPPAWGTRPAG